MQISVALNILTPSKMNRMQHGMKRTEEDKSKRKIRDRLETAEACERKE